MRIVFVVQRYGAEVVGGAEEACRGVATRLAARGHTVDVVTSCARSYLDWGNVLPAGVSSVDGVTVHRLRVRRPRDLRQFDALQGRVVIPRSATAPPFLQREWMRLQGPWIPELPERVAELSSSADVTVFFTYLYWTTWAGVPAAQSPTVLHPAAHDEPPMRLPLFDLVFRLADAFAFASEEEAELVHTRFRVTRPCRIVGLGADLDVHGDVAALRDAMGLGDVPYLVYVGRMEPGKGVYELVDFFAAYRRRHASTPLKLLMVGEQVHPLPEHPDIVAPGFVDERARDAAILGATALVQPSYFESFSLSLIQGWAAGVPALVQSHSSVLSGHSRRSGGGIPYRGYAEFEVGLERLLSDLALRERMGQAGRRYVHDRYSWDAVIDRYTYLLQRVAAGAPQPPRAAALP